MSQVPKWFERKFDLSFPVARPMGEILAGFRNARLRLVDYLHKQDPTSFEQSLLHPRLKQPMRLVDHVYFVAEHDDHHLAWIWELTSG